MTNEDTSSAAKEALDQSGVESPSQISSTGIASTAELAQRIELLEMIVNDGQQPDAFGNLASLRRRIEKLEAAKPVPMMAPKPVPMMDDGASMLDYLAAMVEHIMGTHFRNVDRDALVTAYREHRAALDAQKEDDRI